MKKTLFIIPSLLTICVSGLIVYSTNTKRNNILVNANDNKFTLTLNYGDNSCLTGYGNKILFENDIISSDHRWYNVTPITNIVSVSVVYKRNSNWGGQDFYVCFGTSKNPNVVDDINPTSGNEIKADSGSNYFSVCNNYGFDITTVVVKYSC